jgi:hypothetical protein
MYEHIKEEMGERGFVQGHIRLPTIQSLSRVQGKTSKDMIGIVNT